MTPRGGDRIEAWWWKVRCMAYLARRARWPGAPQVQTVQRGAIDAWRRNVEQHIGGSTSEGRAGSSRSIPAHV